MKKRVGWKKKKGKKMATASSISTFGHSEQRDKKEKLQFKKEKTPSQCEEFS